MKTKTLLCAAATFATAAAIGSTNADYIWTGAVDGDWSNAGNWNPGVPVDTGSGSDLEVPSTERLVFNLFAGNIVPTSNIPVLGGVPNNSTNDLTPQIDLLNGTLTFSAPGFSNQGLAGPRGGTWSSTVGDGDTGNGLASLTLNGNFSQGIARDGQAFVFNVAEDGTLTLNGNGGGSALWFSYDTARRVEILLNGGTFVTPDPLQMLRNSDDLGPSFFDLQAAGSTVTAKFGVDFANLTEVENATGAGLTFRSSTAQALDSQDNGDGTFTVFVVPEPSSLALVGLGTLLIARRRRA